MATSNPIRIAHDLFEQAAAEAQRQKRSIPKQVEYWAELGQICDGLISHADAIGLREGLLTIEPGDSAPVDVDAVFAAVDNARADGSLQNTVTKARVIYQLSQSHPGYLEQLDGDAITIGQFRDGKFQPKD